MQWHELIFSEDRKLKTVRHIVFWTAWWLYFLLCYFLLNQPVPKGKIQPGYLKIDQLLPIKTILLLILYVIACYWMIYILIPFLIKNKWLKGIGHSILLLNGPWDLSKMRKGGRPVGYGSASSGPEKWPVPPSSSLRCLEEPGNRALSV